MEIIRTKVAHSQKGRPMFPAVSALRPLLSKKL